MSRKNKEYYGRNRRITREICNKAKLEHNQSKGRFLNVQKNHSSSGLLEQYYKECISLLKECNRIKDQILGVVNSDIATEFEKSAEFIQYKLEKGNPTIVQLANIKKLLIEWSQALLGEEFFVSYRDYYPYEGIQNVKDQVTIAS